MTKRISPDELRAQVAQGLLNIDRPDILEDSPLSSLLSVRPTGFLGRGKAIRELLLEAAAEVSRGLADMPGLEDHKDLLDAVVTGSSVAAWAKAHGKRREGVSRGLWTVVSGWVSEEAKRLSLLAGTAHHNR